MVSMRLHESKLGLRAALLVAIGAVIGLMLVSTTPDRIGPIGITIFFLLVLIGVSIVIEMVLGFFLGRRPSAAVVWVSALMSTGYIALNTVQVTAGDSVLIILMLVMFGFYWSRVGRRSS